MSAVAEYFKHVIFGNQKQSNKVNDTVAELFAETVKNSEVRSELDAANYIKDYLRYVAKYNYSTDLSEWLAIFVLGPEYYDMAGKGAILQYKQLSQSSPKIVFYFAMPDVATKTNAFGVNVNYWDTAEVEREQTKEAVETVASDTLTVMNQEIARVNAIRDAILPMVPQEVKDKYPDNTYAQALMCAKKYYAEA